MMNYIEITIKTTISAEEIISSVFLELGAKGVVLKDSDISGVSGDYIDSELVINNSDIAFVLAYFPEGNEEYLLSEIKNKLQEIKSYELDLDLGELEITYKEVCDEDWANSWKQYYKPLKIGLRVVIVPLWEQYILKDNEVTVTLDPGMAFGTGQHESTSMCIEEMQGYTDKLERVLDLGCGSGILGICAKKLGAKNVTCVDIDENAVKIAKENAEHNGCEIAFFPGNVIDNLEIREKPGNGYSLILANIIADVIINIAQYVSNIILDNGIFITSGIIKDRQQEVLDTLTACGFTIANINIQGEWVCICAVYRKNQR